MAPDYIRGHRSLTFNEATAFIFLAIADGGRSRIGQKYNLLFYYRSKSIIQFNVSHLSCKNLYLSLTLSVYSAGQIDGHTCPPSFMTHLYLQVQQSSEKLSCYPHIHLFPLVYDSTTSSQFHRSIPLPYFCPIVLNVIYNTICLEEAVNNSIATSIVLFALGWYWLRMGRCGLAGFLCSFGTELGLQWVSFVRALSKNNSNSELFRFFKWTFPLLLWSVTGDAHVNKNFKYILVVYHLNVSHTSNTLKK